MDLHLLPQLRRVSSVVAAAALLAAGAALAQQQQQQPSGLESVLKDLLREGVEGRLSTVKGQVRSVTVREQAGATVVLDVSLAEVAQPEVAALTCDVFDYRLQAIPGMVVDHDPIVAGASKVAVRVTYSGAAAAISTSARVSLVDAGSGAARSHRRFTLAREWTGGGGGAAAPPTQPASVTPPQSTAAAAEPPREPVTLDVTPEAVGDTPKHAAPAPPSVRPPRAQVAAPAVTAVTAARAVPTATPAPTVAMVKPMMAYPVGLDLYALAPKASWTSAGGALPWPGASSDERGFVKPLGRATLADGKSYERVLQVHPTWKPNGYVTGAFEVTIPAGARRFTAGLGFLPGVTHSDGVAVEVAIGTRKLGGRRVRPEDGTVQLVAEVPPELRGQSTTLRLIVSAGPTSTQDWFVWVAPEIR